MNHADGMESRLMTKHAMQQNEFNIFCIQDMFIVLHISLQFPIWANSLYGNLRPAQDNFTSSRYT